jgi:hypothetical protein
MECAVREVDLGCPRKWRVTVTPRVRGHARGAQTTIVTDGTDEIAVVTFDESEGERFGREAPLGRRVALHNCKVATPKYRVTAHRYQLVFDADSVVVGAPGVHAIHSVRPAYLGSQYDGPVDAAAHVVYVGAPREAAFTDRVGLDVGLRGARAAMTLRLPDAPGACAAAGGIGILRLGARVLCRDVRLTRDGIAATEYTSLHLLDPTPLRHGPVPAGLPTVGVGDIKDAVRRSGHSTSFAVRAVMTWHSACGSHGQPRLWSKAPKRPRKAPKPPADLCLVGQLSDATGTLETKLWNAAAQEVLGTTLEQLLRLGKEEFDAVCSAPLYREFEWTIVGTPSTTDDAVYVEVSVVDRVGGAGELF